MQYKYNKYKDEFKTLNTDNKNLYLLGLDLEQYSKDQFGIDPMITGVNRTQAEQDSIYKDDARYIKKKFKSPHQLKQAFDLRSSLYTKQQQVQICKYINNKYNKINGFSFTAKVHDIGRGDHFHIQFVKKN